MHVLVLQAHVSIARETLTRFRTAITRVLVVVLEFDNLLAVLARLRLE